MSLRIVAGRVLAMLAELDREAVKRAGVQALQETLDDELRAQIEPRDLADRLRASDIFRRWPCAQESLKPQMSASGMQTS